MTLILRVSLVLMAVALLAAGAALAIAPLQIASDFSVAATGVAGMGTLRANLGGLLIVLGLFTLAGTRPGHARWLTVPLVLVAAILALRLLHLSIDGLSHEGLRSSLVEVVLIGLLLAGRRAFAAQRSD